MLLVSLSQKCTPRNALGKALLLPGLGSHPWDVDEAQVRVSQLTKQDFVAPGWGAAPSFLRFSPSKDEGHLGRHSVGKWEQSSSFCASCANKQHIYSSSAIPTPSAAAYRK